MIASCRIAAAIALLAASLLAAGCASPLGVQGSGTKDSDRRSVESFESVVVAGAADVVVTTGPTPSVTVEGDDNLLEYVTTTVSRGVLRIDTTRSVRPKERLMVRVVLPDPQRLRVDDAGQLEFLGIQDEELVLELDGTGFMTLEGSVQRLTVRGAGSGDLDAAKLRSATATVELKDSADGAVRVTEQLTATAADASTLNYFGMPRETRLDEQDAGEIIDAGS